MSPPPKSEVVWGRLLNHQKIKSMVAANSDADIRPSGGVASIAALNARWHASSPDRKPGLPLGPRLQHDLAGRLSSLQQAMRLDGL